MGSQYLNNKEFESTIEKFLNAKNNIEENQEAYASAQKDLAEKFYLLAENIIRAFNFQLIDHDDALQEGVMICFEKIDRFRPDKGKAFNYMTTCCLNHYRQLYRTAKNYMELKKKYQEFISNKTLEVIVQQNTGYYQSKKKFRKYTG